MDDTTQQLQRKSKLLEEENKTSAATTASARRKPRQWIRRFILFHNKRHPRDMGRTEVTAFLNHLAINGNVATATQNQTR